MMTLRFFDRILNKLEKGQLYFCVGCMGAIAVTMFLEVFLRNAMGINLQWALEFSALLMVWACFIGSSVVFRRQGHIGIEALVRRLPESLQVLVNVSVYLLICAGLIILFLRAFSLMIVHYGQEIVSLDIPRSALSLPVVLGIGLMVITSVYLILEETQRLRAREEDRKPAGTENPNEPP